MHSRSHLPSSLMKRMRRSAKPKKKTNKTKISLVTNYRLEMTLSNWSLMVNSC